MCDAPHLRGLSKSPGRTNLIEVQQS